jgi:hypothetical protein
MKHPPREPMTLGIFVIAKFCFIVLLSSVGSAQTTQAKYEGQERCGKRASDVFKADYGQQVMHSLNKNAAASFLPRRVRRLERCT